MTIPHEDIKLINANSSYIRKLNRLADFEDQPLTVALKNFDNWEIEGIRIRYKRGPLAFGPGEQVAKAFGLYRGGKLGPERDQWQEQYQQIVDCNRNFPGTVRTRVQIERFLTDKYGKRWKIVLPATNTNRSYSTPSIR